MRKAVNMQQLIIKNIILELIRFNVITSRSEYELSTIFNYTG